MAFGRSGSDKVIGLSQGPCFGRTDADGATADTASVRDIKADVRGDLLSHEVVRRVGIGSISVRMMLQGFQASTMTWPVSSP